MAASMDFKFLPAVDICVNTALQVMLGQNSTQRDESDLWAWHQTKHSATIACGLIEPDHGRHDAEV